MNATSRAGAVEKSSSLTIRPSVAGNSNAGADEPSSVIVDGVRTMPPAPRNLAVESWSEL